MQHGVAIGADRLQVVDWVDLVLFADVGELNLVMNMDEANANRPVALLEVQITNATDGTAVLNARVASPRVTLPTCK